MKPQAPKQLQFPFEEKVKLLVVDDHADTREMLGIFFAGQGYSVVTASTGKDALDALEDTADFDVVLLDIFLPDIGGMELLKKISRRTPCPGVVVLTGLADKEIAQEALRLGAFDYILKPFNLLQLESSVVASFAHKQYLKQRWWKRVA